MRLERLVQKFDTRESLETLSYSVTYLYPMRAVQLYTTLAPMHFEPIHLGGRGPLNPSGPLGLGRTPTGGGSRPLSYTEAFEESLLKVREGFQEEDRQRRLDLKPHHGLPGMHLQHGTNDYFGRTGNEAADIFGELYRRNWRIKLPGE